MLWISWGWIDRSEFLIIQITSTQKDFYGTTGYINRYIYIINGSHYIAIHYDNNSSIQLLSTSLNFSQLLFQLLSFSLWQDQQWLPMVQPPHKRLLPNSPKESETPNPLLLRHSFDTSDRFAEIIKTIPMSFESLSSKNGVILKPEDLFIDPTPPVDGPSQIELTQIELLNTENSDDLRKCLNLEERSIHPKMSLNSKGLIRWGDNMRALWWLVIMTNSFFVFFFEWKTQSTLLPW